MIDDDQNSLILAKKLIENVGYNFEGASSLVEADKIIKECAPHLVLLDIKLDQEDGFSFLNKREADSFLSKIPVVVITQLKQDRLLQKVLSYKGADFLQKPIHPSLLLQKLKKNLRSVETKTYIFEKKNRPVLDITLNGEIIKISEVALKIESPMKFNQEEEISVRAEILDDFKIATQKMLINNKSTSGIEGGYDTEIVMLGVTEESAQKIRKIRRVKE